MNDACRIIVVLVCVIRYSCGTKRKNSSSSTASCTCRAVVAACEICFSSPAFNCICSARTEDEAIPWRVQLIGRRPGSAVAHARPTMSYMVRGVRSRALRSAEPALGGCATCAHICARISGYGLDKTSIEVWLV